MNKSERLLRLCADSLKMSGWNDSLEIMTDKVISKCQSNMLSDDMLENVAGGIVQPDTIKDLK